MRKSNEFEYALSYIELIKFMAGIRTFDIAMRLGEVVEVNEATPMNFYRHTEQNSLDGWTKLIATIKREYQFDDEPPLFDEIANSFKVDVSSFSQS